jgi:hypothetical protein
MVEVWRGARTTLIREAQNVKVWRTKVTREWNGNSESGRLLQIQLILAGQAPRRAYARSWRGVHRGNCDSSNFRQIKSILAGQAPRRAYARSWRGVHRGNCDSSNYRQIKSILAGQAPRRAYARSWRGMHRGDCDSSRSSSSPRGLLSEKSSLGNKRVGVKGSMKR